MDEPGGTGQPPAGQDEFRFSPRPNRAAEIGWRPWGDGPFEEAGAQGKLVLLSVSAVWCHWCHVMDETTYSDDSIIERVNRDFIPVRVDSDRRPDVNRRYNQGGWPTTAFLAPDGSLLTGLTYAPASRLKELLDRLSALYRDRRQEIDVELARRTAAVSPGGPAQPGGDDASGGVDPRTVENVTSSILAAWDRVHGGLGGEPKFPSPGALELALAGYRECGDDDLRALVISTLDAMSSGELFDRVEGGFFRYATARDWSVPHYEKMLSDNADLVSIYLQAAVALGRGEYMEVARRAIDYVLVNLLDDERRGFFGSQDADERYYHRDAEGRAAMERPPVDRTLYVDSSARMVSALVRASAVLEDPDLLSLARTVADFAWREGFRPGAGVCHYFEVPSGRPVLWGMPADQVYLLGALLDIFQASGEPVYLARAVELGGEVAGRYLTGGGWLGEASGGTAGLPSEGDAPAGVSLEGLPPDTPDIQLNGYGARALLALDALAPGRGFRDAAEGVLRSLSGVYGAYSYFASEYALAVDVLERGHLEIRISGVAGRDERRDMTLAAAAMFNPRKVVRPESADDYPTGGDGAARPVAVVCSTGACHPVWEPGELERVTASIESGDPERKIAGGGCLEG